MNFHCALCGKEFEPDPQTIVPTEFSMHLMAEEDAVPEDAMSEEEMEELIGITEEELCRALGLDLTQLDEAEKGETVHGAIVVCLECQEETQK